MKAKCSSLTIASVCPRTTSRVKDTGDKIQSVNAGLHVLCSEEGWTFVDNDPYFHLGDGSINDGYLLGDGVHLTRRATNRLAQNLKLNIRDVNDGVCGSQQSNTQIRNSDIHKQHISDDSTPASRDRHDLNISHAFWRSARRKADVASLPQTTQAPHQHNDHHKHSRYDTPRSSTDNHNYATCYNCGEDNHNERRCRFSYRLQCRTCGQEGHKAKHHESYNNK